MEARTLPNRAAFLAWALAILGAAVLSLVPLSLLDLRPIDAPSLGGGPATNNGPRIAYFEFASTADTLWLADPSDPSRRQKLLVAPHAVDFGVVPSLAPDGRRFVYTALPPATKAPSADTPAGIWMFAPGEKSPRLLDDDADLLVRPVWSSDGGSIVFRRSRPPTQGAPATTASSTSTSRPARSASSSPTPAPPSSPSPFRRTAPASTTYASSRTAPTSSRSTSRTASPPT